ncbi:MAG: lipocalin family protein [Paludibacteraceae bacterium]|nr:lipocalin family protein [Paludibacteraceae bacterium]
MLKVSTYIFSLLLISLSGCSCNEPPVVVEDQTLLVGTWYIHDYTMENVSLYDIQKCDEGSWLRLDADNTMEALIKCNDPVNTYKGDWSAEGSTIYIDADNLFNVNKVLLREVENTGTIVKLTDDELEFEFNAYSTLNVKLKVKAFLSRTPIN